MLKYHLKWKSPYHAFIFSRLDLCNCVFTGLSKKRIIRQLQLEQKAATRVLSTFKKAEHITSVLKSLHWLPILLLTYKTLNWSQAWIHLCLTCMSRSFELLTSSVTGLLDVSWIKIKKVEQLVISLLATCETSFPGAAKTVCSFESGLKTLLFTVAFLSARYTTL